MDLAAAGQVSISTVILAARQTEEAIFPQGLAHVVGCGLVEVGDSGSGRGWRRDEEPHALCLWHSCGFLLKFVRVWDDAE